MQTSTQNGTITAYPLSWPVGWQRTSNPRRSAYGDRSLAAARESVQREVRLFGGRDLIISSNLELRLDGLPRSGQRQPLDKGVAIYFKYKSNPVSFACDKWASVEDNLWAVSLTLSAIRQIERSGASEMLDRAFAGFAALPAPGETSGESWWRTLGVMPTATMDEIKAAYRGKVKVHHPDAGGDPLEFQSIQSAYDAAQFARA